MKITALRLRRLQGTVRTDGPHWEERGVRALDVYPEHRRDVWRPAVGEPMTYFERGEQVDPTHLRVRLTFLQVETDEGIAGLAGPLAPSVAPVVRTQLTPTVLGCDPLATEHIWDVVYRTLAHGRQGDGMLGLSALDCALWDLRGKVLGVPAHRLLGGPTRTSVPAYASMYGYSVSDPGLVRERALRVKEEGYSAQKWFLRHGPADGLAGLRRNVELVRTVREAVGDDDEIMVDAWSGLDVSYATALAHALEELRPRWIEEPVLSGRAGSYRAVRERTRVPVAGGEHEYTRWGVHRFIDPRALDVLQPDVYWTGGLSELTKIAACATVHDIPVIPHGTSVQATAAFSFAQPPAVTPFQEHLLKFSTVTQHFLRHRIEPAGGVIEAPNLPGLGMELDPDTVESETELWPE